MVAHSRKISLALTAFLLMLSGSYNAANAQAWVQLSPTGQTPPPVFGHTAVYDPGTNRMIVFVGVSGNDQSLNQVWVLSNANGIGGSSAWTLLSPTGPPPPTRGFHTAVYDPGTNRMTVFGGFHGGISDVAFNDVWVLTNANGLNGTPQWIQLAPAGGGPNRAQHTAIYDSATNRMTIFGGCSGSPGNCGSFLTNTVWTLINANGLGGTPQWVQLSPLGTLPAARTLHSATYDPASNRMMVFGGGVRGVLNDTWVLTNADGLGGIPQWIQLSPTGSLPPGRNSHRAVYHPETNRMTIFSGASSSTEMNDVWVLSNANGTNGAPTWTQILASGSPPLPREASASVYDPGSNRMIVFGGIKPPNGLNDVWVLLNANGIASSQLGLVQSLPNVGGNAGQVTVRIIGSGFQSGASVKLTGVGSDILGTNTTVANASVLTTTFNLTGTTPGSRTLVVANLDNTTASLPSGFTVEQGGAPQLWVNVLGRDRTRIGGAQTFYISYGNRGNVDAFGAHLVVTFPSSLTSGLGFANEVGVVSTGVTGTDSYIAVQLDGLPAGGTRMLPVILTASQGQPPFQIGVKISRNVQ